MIEALRKPPLLIAGALLAAASAVGALAAAGDHGALARLNLRETELTAQQGRNLNRLSHLLTVLVRFRRDPPPALLVSPGDAVDAARAAMLIKALTPELERRAKLYAGEAGEIARQRRLAAVAAAALFTADSNQADRLAEAAPPADVAETSPLQGVEDTRPVLPPATLLAPAEGPIVRRYGDRLTGGDRARGLTIAAKAGAKVEAPGDGLVQYVGPVKGWGVILILRLAGGYHLVLAGLDRASVGVGQSVAAGAPVGWMADGRQTPAELYLEVRERDAPVDPGRWLKG
ncbi:murein hydrolase activator EnvC [Phenylobacterium aquaticum]|uniref:murein hydrolase activator EnvC family protein n=1 Tax=Phenylobacterium aquaticum TaxID=1763816 RepID=UPI0026F0474A|nr:peptidoglycan DD-metalloendopeptidase family protein [Phenylobacterium aquaticum]